MALKHRIRLGVARLVDCRIGFRTATGRVFPIAGGSEFVAEYGLFWEASRIREIAWDRVDIRDDVVELVYGRELLATSRACQGNDAR